MQCCKQNAAYSKDWRLLKKLDQWKIEYLKSIRED